jgi:hypothetical protein
MPKAIVIVALIALIAVMALPPAYSAPRECTDAHMREMDAIIANMTDRTKKKEAATNQQHRWRTLIRLRFMSPAGFAGIAQD